MRYCRWRSSAAGKIDIRGFIGGRCIRNQRVLPHQGTRGARRQTPSMPIACTYASPAFRSETRPTRFVTQYAAVSASRPTAIAHEMPKTAQCSASLLRERLPHLTPKFKHLGGGEHERENADRQLLTDRVTACRETVVQWTRRPSNRARNPNDTGDEHGEHDARGPRPERPSENRPHKQRHQPGPTATPMYFRARDRHNTATSGDRSSSSSRRSRSAARTARALQASAEPAARRSASRGLAAREDYPLPSPPNRRSPIVRAVQYISRLLGSKEVCERTRLTLGPVRHVAFGGAPSRGLIASAQGDKRRAECSAISSTCGEALEPPQRHAGCDRGNYRCGVRRQ